MKKRKVMLFVKSIKTLIGTEKVDVKRLIWGGPGIKPGSVRMAPGYDVEPAPEYEFVLPKYQRKVAEMVKEVADKLSFDVEIVDASRENLLRRIIQKEIEKIRTFPTLVTDSGEKVEGKISKKQIELLLSKQKA